MFSQDIGTHDMALILLLQDRRRRSRTYLLLKEAGVQRDSSLSLRSCQLLGLLGQRLVAWGHHLERYALTRMPAQMKDPVSWANSPATGQKP